MSEDPPFANNDPVEMGAAIAKQILDVQAEPPRGAPDKHDTDGLIADGSIPSLGSRHPTAIEVPTTAPQEQERLRATLFLLKLAQNDRPAFTSVMEKLSLVNMICAIEPLARHYEARGGTFSESERRIIDLFGKLVNDESHDGRELRSMDLQFRWVSATPDVAVDEIIEEAPIYGGNPSADKSGWVHVGQSVVEDFMANPVHNDPGALLVYNGSKLTPITQDDMDADWEDPKGKHAYMHAQKPVPGLQLRDALVGIISFDERK